MLRLLALALAALTTLACPACISSGPYTPTRYYALSSPAAPLAAQGAAAPLPLTARVQRFTAVSACPSPMVRRLSDTEITYDEFHRWSGSAEEAVGAAFFSAMESHGVFRQVIPPDVETDADVTIEGRILALEQRQDGPASLAIAIGLRLPRQGAYAWFRVLRKSVPIAVKTPSSQMPAATAQALSKALADIAAQCAAEWRELPALQQKTQTPHPAP